MSLWKKYFSWPKLVFLLFILIPVWMQISVHYNLLIGEPLVKQITMNNMAVTVKPDRIESEAIKENNKIIMLQCYSPYCGLMKEGKYILSEVKYIILYDQKPLSRLSTKNIYYLSYICVNKKICFDNNTTNILNKKKTQLINDARFGAFFWIIGIILINRVAIRVRLAAIGAHYFLLTVCSHHGVCTIEQSG